MWPGSVGLAGAVPLPQGWPAGARQTPRPFHDRPLAAAVFRSAQQARSRGASRHRSHARRALVEGAWAYRYPAKVSRHLQLRLEQVSKPIQDSSWKAQIRLCKRYRQLSARGKNANQVVVAIAREPSAFMWAIAQEVPLTP